MMEVDETMKEFVQTERVFIIRNFDLLKQCSCGTLLHFYRKK